MSDVSDGQLKEHLEIGDSKKSSSPSSPIDADGKEVYQELPANNSPLLTAFLLTSTMIGSGGATCIHAPSYF